MQAHRLMRRNDTGSVVKVFGHAMTRNGWEYFLLDPKADSRGNIMALVMGFETEMGDVNMPELVPFMLSYVNGANLNDLMPAEGWEWVS